MSPEPLPAAPLFDATALEAALFGEGDPQVSPVRRLPEGARAAESWDTGRGRRVVVAFVLVLLVVGMGGAAYALFGKSDGSTPPGPRVDVEATSVTAAPRPTASTSPPTSTTVVAPTTTVVPTTSRPARIVAPEEQPVATDPAAEPPSETTPPATTTTPQPDPTTTTTPPDPTTTTTMAPPPSSP